MATPGRIGFFGKLPSHGDFIERDLPGDMQAALDDWLQQALASSREQLGDTWLDIYLTSPVWQFALSPGCLDHQGWLGVMMPSVDAVGRYFPFVMAAPLPAHAGPMRHLLAAEAWLDALGALALQALQQPLDAEALGTAIAGLAPPPVLPPQPRTAGLICEHAPGQPTLVALLDWQGAFGDALSLWRSRGSERVAACSVAARGMPKPGTFTALLDGAWEHRGWGHAQVPDNGLC